MRKWLHTQRQKPKHVRDNIAFVAASVVTVVAFVGWIVILPQPDIFSKPALPQEKNKAFSTFFDELSDQIAGARSTVTPPATTTAPAEQREAAASAAFNPYTATSGAVVETPVAIMVVPTASSSAASSTGTAR